MVVWTKLGNFSYFAHTLSKINEGMSEISE